MAKSASQPASKAPAKSAKPSAPAAAPAKTKPAPAAAAAKSPVSPTVTASAVSAPPRPLLRTTGLSPKEQRLHALLAKAAHKTSGAKPAPGASAQSFSAKTSFAGKKTSFQRKAV